ncbi:MAG: alpha-L-rhamnosidase C-terminal domain-containing protein, partial [Gemmatimonadota bacterium]
IRSARPRFGWIVNDRAAGTCQSAFQVLVATDLDALLRGRGEVWDSGQIAGAWSIDVPYGGPPLAPRRDYFWQVRTWNDRGQPSPWSAPQHFRTGDLVEGHVTDAYPLQRTAVAPVEVATGGAGRWFVDFGRAAFGTLQLTVHSPARQRLEIHLGERLVAPRVIDRQPPGSVRHRRLGLALKPGLHTYTLAIPPDERNTRPPAILMPRDVGEVVPFRYAEIIGLPGALRPADLRQLAVHYPFDANAAQFASSDDTLNQVWELCRYSIQATSFCGIYVDGDRERIAYEGDAYINQLCHYGVDREFALARRSHEHLLFQPTWPTEWHLHSVLMAWADYEYTGNADSLAAHYGDLKAKTLVGLARADGLISSANATDELIRAIHLQHGQLRDIIDWPPGSFTEGGTGERDGYELVECNAVVNAFHCRALELMGRIAAVVGRGDDAAWYAARAARVANVYNERFLDPGRGLYLDGEGSSHASLHANMLPLAFGLVPQARRRGVADFVRSRGMACSVYGAQYLLEALYLAGEAGHALALMAARGDRSWWNMIRAGSTVTLEAWDWKYKNNLDWNHAWGAAPANIIPRYLMGVRPLEPGMGRLLVQPRPASLQWARLRLPTIRGAVEVAFEQDPGRSFELRLRLPANTSGRVELPAPPCGEPTVHLDGEPVLAARVAGALAIHPVGSGEHVLRWAV